MFKKFGIFGICYTFYEKNLQTLYNAYLIISSFIFRYAYKALIIHMVYFDVTLLFMKSLRQKFHAFVLKTITVDVLKSIT